MSGPQRVPAVPPRPIGPRTRPAGPDSMKRISAPVVGWSTSIASRIPTAPSDDTWKRATRPPPSRGCQARSRERIGAAPIALATPGLVWRRSATGAAGRLRLDGPAGHRQGPGGVRPGDLHRRFPCALPRTTQTARRRRHAGALMVSSSAGHATPYRVRPSLASAPPRHISGRPPPRHRVAPTPRCPRSPPPRCLFRLIAVCLAFLAAAPVLAQPTLPKGVTRVTSVEGITEYRLENGLKVLLFPDLSKPTITVNITYLVGSRHENYGETGMAHLLEHLMFKGTPKNPDLDKQFNAARRPLQRHHLARPHQLLRALPGHRRQPQVGHRAWRPTGW